MKYYNAFFFFFFFTLPLQRKIHKHIYIAKNENFKDLKQTFMLHIKKVLYKNC